MATQALPAELGTRATEFALKDVHGQLTKLADVRGQNGTVVAFICNHCPYVKAITDRLVRDAETLKNEAISLVTINSNDAVSYPGRGTLGCIFIAPRAGPFAFSALT